MVEEAVVTDWLDALGVGHEPIEPDEPDDYAWALQIEPSPFSTLVAQRAVEFNHLVMRARISIADAHKELLREISADDRDRFLHDLRIELFRTPVGTEVSFDESDPPILVSLTFGYNLFEEPLQRGGFFRRHHQLQSAALLAVQMIRKLDRFKSWPA